MGGLVDRLTLLVLDANVLIDLVGADRQVLARLAGHVRVLVPASVLREVEGIDEGEARAMGIGVLEARDQHLDEVVLRAGGPLSVQDRLCLALARDERAVCVTNDRALQRACVGQGVSWMWGLTPLVHLVAAGAMTAAEALAIAEHVRNANPFHIREETLRWLRQLVERAASGTVPEEAWPRSDV